MNEIEDRARSQLMVIEQVQSVRIAGRDEVARAISQRAESARDVMAVCTTLNLWISINGVSGDVEIPDAVLAAAFSALKRPDTGTGSSCMDRR